MFKIYQNSEFGRYVEATEFILAGTEIEFCELLVLSPNDTKIVNSTDLQFYTFKYNETQDCLVLGNGEIFNHSDNPNVGYKIAVGEARSFMIFKAIKHIQVGEQLFIDYGADTKVNTNNYVNKNLL
jgi:SET domain-containing protein